MSNETAWQRLAERYNLVYVPRQQWRKPRVTGQYRGYQLSLSTYTFGLEVILTATSPRPHPPAPPLEVKNIHPLLLDPYLSNVLGGYFRSQDQGQRFFYHQLIASGQQEFQQLQRLLNHLGDLADGYRQLQVYGGEVIPLVAEALACYPKFSRLARQLLQDIAAETAERLAQNAARLVCRTCFYHCVAQPALVPGRIESLDITYYGCRRCGQSRNLVECRRLVCILDERMAVPYEARDDIWRVNWLQHRRLFDFERVELIRASDEMVERLVVQMANNTDPDQKAGYWRMACVIGPDCTLSPNTLKLLRRIFRQVEPPPPSGNP